VTILADNDPKDRYYYLLTVLTGWKNQAGTTSVVSFYMTGSDGISRTHVMMDEDKELFLTGAEDWFLATEPDGLGELEMVNVWIDCTGLFPAWSVFPSLSVPPCCSHYCTVVSHMPVRPSIMHTELVVERSCIPSSICFEILTSKVFRYHKTLMYSCFK